MAWLAAVTAYLVVIESLAFCGARARCPWAMAVGLDVPWFLAVVTDAHWGFVFCSCEVDVHCVRSWCLSKSCKRCLNLGLWC
jgi:hypothetical protein